MLNHPCLLGIKMITTYSIKNVIYIFIITQHTNIFKLMSDQNMNAK